MVRCEGLSADEAQRIRYDEMCSQEVSDMLFNNLIVKVKIDGLELVITNY